MTLSEYKKRKIPDYYPTMYQDGFTPEEINYAAKKIILDRWKEMHEEPDVKITSTIKVK